MEEVTLNQILEAREARAAEQARLLSEYALPLVSFTMNIPGPVKDTPLIRRAFDRGCAALKAALQNAKLPAVHEGVKAAATGCEALLVVRGDAHEVKRLCTEIEDASPLGRLFDLDVLSPDGRKLDREEVGGGARNCIVCGAKGRGCASRRVHSVEELQEAARRILEEHFAAADRQAVSALVTRALLDEVYTTPKPGLVDRNNNGSHADMTVATFERSAAALSAYWGRCFQIGCDSAAERPEATFARLRTAGVEAERDMLAATGGVNTHKGAIFTLGVLCGAIGRLWRPDAPCRDAGKITEECAAMTSAAMEVDFAALTPETARTAGERLYLAYGLRGIRGEIADGLPGVRDAALPALCRARAAGYSRNDAGVYALLALIARGTDTNLFARGGAEAAREASAAAGALLTGDGFPDPAAIARLDETFIRRNLSPGGSADLLAAALFLDEWSEKDAGTPAARPMRADS